MQIRKSKNYRIRINFKDFKVGIPKNTDSKFEFTGKELIHAILTCGVINPLSETSKEFKYKKYAIECQFENRKDELYLSKEYDFYDQSEKNCLSYYRGMIFGNLIANKRFDLDYFVHLSTFTANKLNTINKNPLYITKQPDIICWNKAKPNDYYVWECKGYRNGIKKGKEQASSINKVNGNDVKLNIVSAVYPTDKLHKIYACVKDPKGYDEEIKLNINEALESYYAPIIHILETATETFCKNEMYYGIINLNNENYTLGLPKKIFEYFNKDDQETLCHNEKLSLEQIICKCSEEHFDRKENVFSDFIYIG